DLGDGSLRLNAENVPGRGVHFEREFSLQCVTAFDINFGGASFSRFVRLSGVRARDISGYNSNFHAGTELHLISARMLDFTNAQFGIGYALDWGKIRVEDLDLQGIHASEGTLQGLDISKSLKLQKAVITGNLTISDSTL